MSYHNGSVWPHDTALCAAGLMRYGFVREAQQVAMGILEAAETSAGALPELFCGFDRAEFPEPWSTRPRARPRHGPQRRRSTCFRTLLRFEPCVPCHQLRIAPALPRELGEVRIDRLPFAGGRVSIRASENSVEVNGLPPDIELVQTPGVRTNFWEAQSSGMTDEPARRPSARCGSLS